MAVGNDVPLQESVHYLSNRHLVTNTGMNEQYAESSAFTIPAELDGVEIFVRVTGFAVGYNPFAVDSSKVHISTTGQQPTGQFTGGTATVTGTPTVGSTLTGSYAGFNPTPTGATWQWLRNGSPIAGATSPTYLLVAADAGTSISVRVTVSAAGYASAVRTSAAVSVVGATPPTTFPDVAHDSTFFTQVEWLYAQGITTGMGDGTGNFGATQPIQRQAIAAWFYRAAGSPDFTPPATPTFADVPLGHPFHKEIEWLYAKGITGGMNPGAPAGQLVFGTAAPIERQAVAAWLYRATGSPAFTPGAPSFPDAPRSNNFFKEISPVDPPDSYSDIGRITIEPIRPAPE
jgi:hypothetical protein